jgi:hypothetical protein
MYNFVEVSGHNLIALILEVSVHNAYITNQFKTTYAHGGGGIPLVEVSVNRKEEKF